jgi:2-polyprenyl-6-methoxyphenol hydroxylase-like FAD-dependent oxidoreductase
VDDETAAEIEVLIAGAGPVGLALALELQRFGIRFRIVEKKAGRSTTSKALGLQPRLSEVFAILGLADEFFARGFDGVRALNLNAGEKKLLRMELEFPPNVAGCEACQPRLIMIPQSTTEEIFELALAERGHAVERRRELVEFSQDRDSVSAVIRDEGGAEETIRAKFLVGCEGAHSIVRKQAGLTFTGATFPLRTLLADVTIDWDFPDNEVQAWFNRDGSFAALPFGDQKWRLVAECATDPGNAAPEVTLEQMQALIVERTGKKSVRLRDPLWLSDFRINARMVDRFRERRVFVAGDAAHIHSPAGGQGIATGIQDATNLAWKLAAFLRAGAPDSLLDTYDEERRPIAREVLRRTSAVTKIIFALNPIASFVRERLLVPVMRQRFVRRRMFAKLSQLEMNYRGRRLAVHSDAIFSRVQVRAGDRTPDVVFKRGGEKVSLFQLIGTFGMIALLGPGENVREIADALTALEIRTFLVMPDANFTPPAECLEDLYGDFARLYGVRGSFLYLIRPDGHVAFFQRRAQSCELASYLKKIRAPEAVEKTFALLKCVSSRAA